MRELQFRDAFDQVFKDNFKVAKSDVLAAYRSPTKKEQLNNNIALFLKKLNNEHLSYLLIATQNVNNEELFAFAYWIPEQLIRLDLSLVDNLEVFANYFGCKVRISDKEGYFIRKARKLIQGNVDSSIQVMEILDSVHIPCQSYCFYKENVGYKLNWVDCFYCFAINNNKYLIWLYNIETITIKVKSEWYNYLSEIRDVLNPFGKTGINILSVKKVKNEGITSHRDENALFTKETELEIPKSYLKPFARINYVLYGLKANEKIAVIPRFENNKCVFCGSENTNREHIFAVWMKGYFDERVFRSTLHIRLPEENLLSTLNSGLSKGAESSYGYTTHQVCVECNGTWMSQLEEKTKNIIALDSSTLKKTINTLYLNDTTANQLAIWITVKAVLLAIKSNLLPNLPLNTFKDLKSGKMPKGFLVEIAECEIYDLNFIVNKGASALGSLLRLKKMDKLVADELTKDFFMVSIQVGQFLFRVSYFDELKGLKREGCIIPTIILFPYGYNLPYLKTVNEQERWEQVDKELKLHIFNIGLSLTDH